MNADNTVVFPIRVDRRSSAAWILFTLPTNHRAHPELLDPIPKRCGLLEIELARCLPHSLLEACEITLHLLRPDRCDVLFRFEGHGDIAAFRHRDQVQIERLDDGLR